mgnify:CR=1 FL=1
MLSLIQSKKNGKWFQEKLSIRRGSTIKYSDKFPVNIKVPLEVEKTTLVIPKVLFPWNEESLKFMLYNMLEKSNVRAFLEPRIPVITKSIYRGYGKLTKLRPDVVVCEPYLQIWEVENFWKEDINELLKHPREYEKILGIKCFAFLWKSKWIAKVINEKYLERKINDWIVQVNPITGKLENASLLYSYEHHPQVGIEFEYTLPGSSSYHSRIQYELAVWLWKKGEKTAFEIPISHEGKVYAPNEIRINQNEGIISWKPFGWWSYAIDFAPPTVTVDVVSMGSELINGYEIKSRRELCQASGKKSFEKLLSEPREN